MGIVIGESGYKRSWAMGFRLDLDLVILDLNFSLHERLISLRTNYVILQKPRANGINM